MKSVIELKAYTDDGEPISVNPVPYIITVERMTHSTRVICEWTLDGSDGYILKEFSSVDETEMLWFVVNKVIAKILDPMTKRGEPRRRLDVDWFGVIGAINVLRRDESPPAKRKFKTLLRKLGSIFNIEYDSDGDIFIDEFSEALC